MEVFNTESKIELNIKQLEFYYNLYDKLQSKFSFLVVIYSFIFIYLIELFKFVFEIKLELFDITFLILFLTFLIFLFISLTKTYNFLKPIYIAYLHEPNYFYNEILSQYQSALNIDDEELLNEYVNCTYLKESEIALQNNNLAYQKKSKQFDTNFRCILYTLILYLIASSFVIFEKRNQTNTIEVKNYKEIVNYINNKNMSEKPKIDPKLVITSNPVLVKQGTLSGEIKQSTVKKDSSSGNSK